MLGVPRVLVGVRLSRWLNGCQFCALGWSRSSRERVWAAPGVDDDYSGVSAVVAAAGGAEPRGVRSLCMAGLTVVLAVGSLLVVMGVGDLSEGWRRCGSS